LDQSDQFGNRRYRHPFDHAPICIFVIDLSRTPAVILEANRQAELMFGYTTAELAGMPAAKLAPIEAEATMVSVVQQVRRGHIERVETTNRHRDGTLFPARVIAALDPMDVGKTIVTVEDISAETQRRNEAQAIDAERRRIAHEIHDGVAQSLAGLRFKSAFWSHLAETAPPGMETALDELQTIITDAIVDLRRAIFALRPIDLDALGFGPALIQLVENFGDLNQLAARLDLYGPVGMLPAAYELPLFRIIQEGLNNVGAHASASSVGVCMAVDTDGGVTVSLRDNGRGFEPHQLGPADREGHFGLRQMRERVVSRGGTMDIHSAPGRGTELVISLPSVDHGASYATD
jgi:PAS domain S-box-containing protein